MTKEYLDKFSDFTFRMLYSLLDDLNLPNLTRYNSAEIKVYQYRDTHLIQYISTNSGYDYNTARRLNEKPERSLRTVISSTEICFTESVQDYIHEDVLQDLFSLSTVLSESELAELYVSRIISRELSTCNKLLSSNIEAICINFSFLYEYYTKYGEK